MRLILALAVFVSLSLSALADNRALITSHMQEMSDAIVSGGAGIWDKYLDAGVIFAEEDDTYSSGGRAGTSFG
jgi:hypothetical protein